MPGNDDAMRAIHLYCDLVSSAVLDGLQAELAASGVDIGARAEAPVEELPEAAIEGLAAAETDGEGESAAVPPPETEPAEAHA